ncbi:hypothetical protein SAMN02745823_03828 [Sporobacter termitidis DSM 10068]|uniref:Uncharacterized protein n=1 Tax=Sporobacter termitidis DSM 10068 TaxID=1123282 RepID=A0A1M5ZJG7_9FIRM|nr:hypothetical protein [Sporobacter termitidis]SHI24376.1 hypothetical protein SAMN02745823_03828 [Sporobacter termitidis DSM 10068]
MREISEIKADGPQTISEYFALIDHYDNADDPRRRADWADALVDELLDIFDGPDDLEKMCTAWREERCVVLLPIDQDVYIIQDGEILGFRVYEYSLISVNNKNVRYWAECLTDTSEDNMDFWQDDIGVTVFTAAAEAALQGKGDSNG